MFCFLITRLRPLALPFPHFYPRPLTQLCTGNQEWAAGGGKQHPSKAPCLRSGITIITVVIVTFTVRGLRPASGPQCTGRFPPTPAKAQLRKITYFRRNTEKVEERRGSRDEMERRCGREAGRGKQSDSACASHGHKRPQDAGCTRGEVKGDFLFIVVCCPQVRKKVPRTTHILTPKISHYGQRTCSVDKELAT